MEIEWDESWSARPPARLQGTQSGTMAPRLDALLPTEPETGAVAFPALRAYLNAMMEMAARHLQPLSLLRIAVDDIGSFRPVTERETALIGPAIARHLRQETRLHDVIGCTEEEDTEGIPSFFVVLPMMTEGQTAKLAERVRTEMTARAALPELPELTFSVGIASMAIDVSQTQELMARATAALHAARRKGGGCTWKHSDTVRRIVENNEPEPPHNSDGASIL